MPIHVSIYSFYLYLFAYKHSEIFTDTCITALVLSKRRQDTSTYESADGSCITYTSAICRVHNK